MYSTESEGLGHFTRSFIATGINYLNPKVNIYFDGSFVILQFLKLKIIISDLLKKRKDSRFLIKPF